MVPVTQSKYMPEHYDYMRNGPGEAMQADFR